MKFCPKCQKVYLDSYQVCPHCDTLLIVIIPNLSEVEEDAKQN